MGRGGRLSSKPANLPSCTTPTMRNVFTFSGRSVPKCRSIGASLRLKKQFTNASVTIATGAVFSLSAGFDVTVQCRGWVTGDENVLASIVGQRIIERHP